MKVVAVLGSPHKNGASNTIANAVLKRAENAGHEVVKYYINDMYIKGCQACRTCKREHCDCIIDDDLKPYWKDLHECGALLISSPNYCSQVTGPMITFMNRHYCIMMIENGKGVSRLPDRKKLIGVFSQGSSDKDAYYENYKTFLHDFEVRNMELCDMIIHTGSDPFDDDSDIIKHAYELGQSL